MEDQLCYVDKAEWAIQPFAICNCINMYIFVYFDFFLVCTLNNVKDNVPRLLFCYKSDKDHLRVCLYRIKKLARCATPVRSLCIIISCPL